MGYVSLDPKPPSRLRDLLARILWPNSWYMQNNYNPEYDRFMRMAIILNMISTDEITSGANYTVRVGSHRVWVANYPYAYATVYHSDIPNNTYSGRPSIQTIRALRKVLALMGITGEFPCS